MVVGSLIMVKKKEKMKSRPLSHQRVYHLIRQNHAGNVIFLAKKDKKGG